MTISSPEREAKKVKIAVDRNPVETSFEKWAKPGHFSRTLAKEGYANLTAFHHN
jgi:photosystem I P700 chlorophyll a apoprotein A1